MAEPAIDRAPVKKRDKLTRVIAEAGERIARVDLKYMAQKHLKHKRTPAADRVFALPELLEQILEYLPQRELLLNQSVCRTWLSTIEVSPTLQQKLWFQPPTRPASSVDQAQSFAVNIINPLCALVFNPWDLVHFFKRNPSIQDRLQRELGWYANRKLRRAVLRQDASWRKMLVVNRPVRFEFEGNEIEWPRMGDIYDAPWTSRTDFYSNVRAITKGKI
ncbi:hypothetical protein K490DRAFT_53314 [Saccharata proteae CBS 121410]|uniref:F-box domain-containing protein n=1 Tax=Saccharata proteae CBS 121410 TaxID=1314787 RepID=A0A9P4M0D5_9PEZI|nr:hypothetical protein K490DRAFT_53314 [Saccharata proteae CBS 121410]